MQNKHTIRDRCILLTLLFIFSIGTYSLFGNIKNINFSELANYQHRVKGQVTDFNGIPIPGVNVGIKGTSYGTFTNKEGYFYVDAAPTDVLTLSYIGFKPLEVTVGSSEELSLVLEEDVTSLEAVTVNAGYYRVKERERTGSIAKVTAEEIELQPIVSPLEALQGRMAGVEIQQPNGMPGSAPIIRIRGTNSLRKDANYPLYIIDGIPVNSAPVSSTMGFPVQLLPEGIDPLSTLSLSNIESIEILKDADATAIYGSRGANGVVLITTRKGTGFNQKTQLDINWYSGIGQIGRKMKMLDTRQYVALRKAAMTNAGVEPDASRAPDLVLWDTIRNTNWQKELLGGNAFISNINLSLSGGNSNTSYRLHGSLRKQGNVFPEDIEYKKATAGLRMNHQSTNDKLNLSFVLNYGMDQSNSFAVNKIVESAYLLPPNAPPIYNADRSLNWNEWNLFNWDNPLATKYTSVDAEINNLLTSLTLSYELLPGLSLKTNLGYSRYTRETLGKSLKLREPPEFRDNIENEARKGFQKHTSWIVEPQLTYNKSFGKLNLNTLVGSTLQKNVSNGVGILGVGFSSEALIGDLNSANQYYNLGGRFTEYKYNALFGRFGFNWSHKYFLNLTARRDGSSRFGPNNRFSNFWAVGTAWIFSKESFIKKHLPFLSFGKIRASYGTTGNDQIGDYQYLDSYEATAAPGGLYPTSLFNPNFAWEENKKLESTLELAFLKDRINVELSWYNNRSSNQLVGYSLPAMTGFSSVQSNLPATVQNTGWELELTTINVKSKNLLWQTSFNISFPKNKLIEFPGIEQTSYARTYKVGHPLSIITRYKYDGIDPETKYHRIKDVNGDGSYDYEDRIVIKNAGRQYYGGINNSFSFKGFKCSFLWDFIKQKSVKNIVFTRYSPGYSGGNYNRAIEDYTLWKSGMLYLEDTYSFNDSYIKAQGSDYGWVDSSFIRLKTLAISYDIAPHWLNDTGIEKLRLFLSAQNLFTISSYAGINLESNPTALSIPALKIITSGVQIQF